MRVKEKRNKGFDVKREENTIYFVSGILFILSGALIQLNIKLLTLYRINFIKLIGLILIFIGFFSMIFNLKWKVYLTPASASILALSMIIFFLSSVNIPLFVEGEAESYCLAGNNVSVVNIKISTSTGNIYLKYSENKELLYNITFKKIKIPFFMEESKVSFKNRTINDALFIEAETDFSNVELVISGGKTYLLDLSTSTGNLRINLSGELLIESLTLQTYTGNIILSLKDLEIYYLKASSNTGNIKLNMEFSKLQSNFTSYIRNRIGSVWVNVEFTSQIGCEFKSETSIGGLTLSIEGFEVVKRTPSFTHLKSVNFDEAAYTITLNVKNDVGDVRFNGRLRA